MQPIRKQEQEFHDKLIESKSQVRKNELDRRIRMEAEKLTEKNLTAFKKKIKADKLLDSYKLAVKEYDAFNDQKDVREKQLERKKEEACEKLTDHLQAQAKIYGWDNENRISRDESISHYETNIREACNQEAMTHIKQSDLGTKYQSMGIVEEQCKIALYKGDPLDTAVKNISSIMKQVGIVYFNSKVLQISDK
tara:strand:+ start:56 stop:637 length:582 start_codon:yes stop_codon:yes gene_type:complete